MISDIWIGTYKLRVNLARFAKGDPLKEKEIEGKGNVKARSTVGEGVEALAVVGRSFNEALVNCPLGDNSVDIQREATDDGETGGVTEWEVEVEPEAMSRLKGSYVGYLTESKEHALIQRTFTLDGYHNLKITPLGHMKVLISSSVEGEVKELIGTVGWWCTWFERFEEWSTAWVSKQRSVWLSCHGVPLHAWGEAIFRTIGFKYGTYIGIDSGTKNMERGDVARIKIDTESVKLIDSSIMVVILGVKFCIRVMEEAGGLVLEENSCCGRCGGGEEVRSGRGSGEGGSVVAVMECETDSGDDSDWSESRQEVLGTEVAQGQQGENNVLRLEMEHGNSVSGGGSTNMGNSLDKETKVVNHYPYDNEDLVEVESREMVLHGRIGGDRGKVTWNVLML
ncbi:hypothetical protein QL285_040814 [Trifolium repens]|nr:hypothetical protein QL285_040814 [Trifolium repens]